MTMGSLWMTYLLAAAAASGVFVVAGWRSKAAGSVAASIDAFFSAQSSALNAPSAQLERTAADADKSAIVVLRPHL